MSSSLFRLMICREPCLLSLQNKTEFKYTLDLWLCLKTCLSIVTLSHLNRIIANGAGEGVGMDSSCEEDPKMYKSLREEYVDRTHQIFPFVSEPENEKHHQSESERNSGDHKQSTESIKGYRI